MSWGAALFGLAVFLTRKQIFDPGCTGQIVKFTGQIRESRVFFIVYSDDTYFFEPALPALASAGGEHGLVA